jgi:hypothetical protein
LEQGEQPTETGLVYVPKKLQKELVKYIHSAKMHSHQGIAKTIERLTRNYHFKGIKKVVEQVVHNYVTCGKNNVT